MRNRRVFGLDLASDFPFASPLPPAGDGNPDLTFSRAAQAPAGSEITHCAPVYSTPFPGRDGTAFCRLYCTSAGEALRFSGGTAFHLGEREIVAVGAAPAAEVEEQLLGPTLAYWLELRGVVALHAAAVRLGDVAVAIAGSSGAGKSSLAAALLDVGGSLLTDDLLAVDDRGERERAHPGCAQIRLSAAAAARWGATAVAPATAGADKRRVHVGTGGLGSFCARAVPLAHVVVLNRGEPGARFDLVRLRRREALMELVRHSYTPRLVEAAGLQPRRLERLVRLAARIPAYRLVYPSGFDRLSEVADALRHSLAATATGVSEPLTVVLGYDPSPESIGVS